MTPAFSALPLSDAAATASPGPGDRASPELARLFAERGRSRSLAAGSTLLLHGAPADLFFRVVSGVVRCCAITENGHRFIFRFVRPGEYVGFPDLEGWHFTAEAVGRVDLLSVARDAAESRMAVNPRLQREVRHLISSELTAREQHLVMLSYARAEERLLWFLEGFRHAVDADGFASLPMTRQDIGDHLGMTIETVSRTFSALKRRERIEVRGSSNYRIARQQHRIAA